MKKILVFLLLLLYSFTMMGFSLGEEKLKEISARLAIMKVPENGEHLWDRNMKKTYSGFEFKKLYPGTFLKLMTPNENHKGFQYKEGEGFQYKDGVCTDTNPFCNDGSCVAGGLYFTDIWRIQNHYTNDNYDHFREIEIPDDAVVYIDQGKFKASSLCLTTRGESQNQNALISDIRELISAVVQRFHKDNPEHLLLKEVDFYRANLRGAKLQGADFQEANLEGVKFQEADLHGVKLQKAKLVDADFDEADLHEANLEGAKLYGAYFQKAKLQWANLEGAKLERAHFQRANLQGTELHKADLQEANLEGVNLQWANLEGANLYGAYLQKADLQWANLEGATIDYYVHNKKVSSDYLQNHGALNIDKCILSE